ncbi:MAG: neuraminidase-like domain-containing protein, partial [Myxococcota bacterium]
ILGELLVELNLTNSVLLGANSGLPSVVIDDVTYEAATFADLEIAIEDATGLDVAVGVETITVSTTDPTKALYDLHSTHFQVTTSLQVTADFQRLLEYWKLLTTIGASLATAKTWVTATPDRTMAAQLRSVRAAKLGETTWENVGRKLRDDLRIRQQTALLAWLSRGTGPKTPSEFYATYFVEAQMDPCFLTSRLKLAIGTTQTYVNALLLGEIKDGNGDPLVVASDQQDAWRTWRGTYRMWEAARKALLFTENWLDPTLRLERSPEYRAFDAALQARGFDDHAAQQALAGYLRGIMQYGNPLIVATVYHRDDIHVIARAGDNYEQPVYRRGRWIPPPNPEEDAPPGAMNLPAQRWRWSPWAPVPFTLPLDKPANVYSAGGLEHRVALHPSGDELIMVWALLTLDSDQTKHNTTVSVTYAVMSADGTWSSPQAAYERTYGGIAGRRLDVQLLALGDPESDNLIGRVDVGGYEIYQGLWAVVSFETGTTTGGNLQDHLEYLLWSPTLRRLVPQNLTSQNGYDVAQAVYPSLLRDPKVSSANYETDGDGRYSSLHTSGGTQHLATPVRQNGFFAIRDVAKTELWGDRSSLVFPSNYPSWRTQGPFFVQYNAHSFLFTPNFGHPPPTGPVLVAAMHAFPMHQAYLPALVRRLDQQGLRAFYGTDDWPAAHHQLHDDTSWTTI